MEVDSDFLTTVRNSLQEGQIEHIYSIFQDDSYIDVIQNNSWELISCICQYINNDVKTSNLKLFECCNNVIDIIATKLAPEDSLLQFIEEIENTEDDITFVALLRPVEKILLQIPSKRQNSLAWCFNAIETFLHKLDIPENYDLEKAELILMDADAKVARITHLLNDELVPFYEVFVQELLTNNVETGMDEKRLIVLKFLIQLLGKPLAYLDMEADDRTKSRSRRIAEKICENILKLLEDPITLTDIYPGYETDVVSKPTDLSQAVLFYLLFGEQIMLGKIPKVYNAIYIFQTYLHLIPILLDNAHQLLVTKGLKLAGAFIQSLNRFELDYQLLDSESHSKFCKQLSLVIIYNSSERNRKASLKILQEYLNRFDVRGRYLLVYNLIQVVNHAGLIGFIISYYKDMLNDALNNNEQNMNKYLCSSKLFTALQLFCHLHKGEQSDLIEVCDQIIASLNLLRYLAIRDKKNVTNIWDYFPVLEKSYFEPLKKGLMLSKAHYELKLQDLKNNTADGDKKQKTSNNLSVVVGGETLPEMPLTEKMKVLKSALTAFDVMESVLGRVVELTKNGPSI